MPVILATQEVEIRKIGVQSQPRQIGKLGDPISKTPITKKGWWRAQGIGPEFRSQYCPKINK
jgi:hypothetical protein